MLFQPPDNPAAGERPDDGRPRGFTMVEILVAISLLATLTAIVWVSINNMFRTRNFMTDRYERFQIIRVALDRMNSEIASAYVAGSSHGAEEKFEDEQAAASAEQQNEKQAEQLTEATREPVQFGMKGSEDELNFTSFAHMRMFRSERASHHAEIGYFIESRRNEDGELVKSLMRREDTTLDDDITEGGRIYTLIPNVKDVEFEYWDPGEVQVGTQEENAEGRWRNDWDTENRQYHDRLPMRVRIKVTLPAQSSRQDEEVFTTETEIMTHEILEF